MELFNEEAATHPAEHGDTSKTSDHDVTHIELFFLEVQKMKISQNPVIKLIILEMKRSETKEVMLRLLPGKENSYALLFVGFYLQRQIMKDVSFRKSGEEYQLIIEKHGTYGAYRIEEKSGENLREPLPRSCTPVESMIQQ